ncbi:hypothetical protein [Jannaschia pohangensis]|uniref:Uncharacterized protein n=1 Tax=Jannaschia pohangensis TaxID=390807 RepID=A0A1I3JAM0_9RHOB|nr:hypothetical protein [Jannaschia pohangensis]SFI57249.1 hypothetical protein SAMN04488095_1265 [Jannaschia pohangensis]
MRALITALAVLMALPAAAHDYRYDPAVLWFDAPKTTDAGDARIRIVFHGQEGAAALTPNQYWFYANAYRNRMIELSRHGVSVARATLRARHDAFHATAAAYPGMRVDGFKLTDLDDPRLTPSW